MDYINGCTFGFMSRRGFTGRVNWQDSLQKMKESTFCDTAALAVASLQDDEHSLDVQYMTDDVMSMDDVRHMIRECKRLGLKVLVKAMVNCRNGVWRANIRFDSDEDWFRWFSSYGNFVCELAETAAEEKAEMFCVGCEMIGADGREKEWRKLIRDVRSIFKGPLTYNCDKWQEDKVKWWDAVDAISSSGYYPINEISENFLRIKTVSEKYDRPFFFIESGCPSRDGSENAPYDWTYGGELSLEAQRKWYKAFCDELLKNPWIRGSVWWDWPARLYPVEHAVNPGYCMYGKPAAEVLREYSRAVGSREHS